MSSGDRTERLIHYSLLLRVSDRKQPPPRSADSVMVTFTTTELTKSTSALWRENPDALRAVVVDPVYKEEPPLPVQEVSKDSIEQSIERFIRERCVLSPASAISTREFYDDYVVWYTKRSGGLQTIHINKFSPLFYAAAMKYPNCKRSARKGKSVLQGFSIHT